MKTTRLTTRKETTRSESTVTETRDPAGIGSSVTASSEDLPSADDYYWTYAETFYIVYPPTAGNGQSAQAKVFANDRQHVAVEVVISPRDANGTFKNVPVDVLQSMITFVRYSNGLPIPSTWSVDREPNEYTRLYWAVPDQRGEFSDDDRSPDDFPKVNRRVQDQIVVPFYIRASAADDVQIAASIKPPGASQAIETRPGVAGGFDSSLTINARHQPNVDVGVGPGSDGFSLSVHTRPGSQQWTRYNDWLVSLRLRGTNVRLKHLVLDPWYVPALWWHSQKGETWGPWCFSFVLAAQPDSYVPIAGGLPGKLKAVSGDSQFDTGHWYPSPVIGDHDGGVGFLFVSSTENFQFHYSDGKLAAENLVTRFHVIDEFGNQYGMWVEISDVWDELKIRKSDFRESGDALHERNLSPEPSRHIARTEVRTETRTETTTETRTESHGVEAPAHGPQAHLPPQHVTSQRDMAVPVRPPRTRHLPSSRRPPQDATAWTRLSAFRIEPVKSESPGQIRTRLRVSLAAWDANGAAVTIPDAELEKILTLVDHEKGLPLSSEWEGTHATEPPEGAEEQRDAGGRALQTFDFWVTARVACPAATRLAASIYPPDGVPPIQTRPGYSDGDTQFDSWVDLKTRRDRLWEISKLDLIRESASDKVFGNGLQQIRFKVELAFKDNLTGEPGVPDDTLDTIGIALFEEGSPLPVGPASSGWSSTPGVASSADLTYFNGYDSYPDSVAVHAVDAGSPRASSFRYFYVAYQGDQALKVKLCAYVKCRDGWLYTGNDKAVDECGHEEVGYAGRSEEVASVAPEEPTIAQFPWEFDTLPGGNGSVDTPPTNPETVRRYTLSYTDKKGNQAGLRYLQIAPEFPLPPEPPAGKYRSAMIEWHDQVPGEHRACFTGYAPPGSTTVVWDETLPNGAPVPLPTFPSANKRAAVVLLVGRQNIPFRSGMQKGPLILTTTDWYGTTTTLRLAFEGSHGDGRWKLVLSK